MRHLPRLAVGTIQSPARREPVVWAIVAALQAAEASPVVFRSSCGFAPHDVAQTATGRRSRHLDTWAMSRSAAAQAMLRASGTGDMAIVEGCFDAALPAAATDRAPCGSSLDRLCDWLDMPRVAIVDVRELTRRGAARPTARFDALVLDRVSSVRDAVYWQTTLEALWQTPVLGWLDGAPALRALCETLPPGANPSSELCEALAARLLGSLRLDKLVALANRAPPLVVAADEWSPEAWSLAAAERHFRIAVAYDETYCGYYPETLDLLEAAGAELCDFSPLRSGAIPDGADVVYFGCGHPELDPERLAGNHCLKQSLRCFAAGGGRIYAEGSGLAYLCREIAFPGEQSLPGRTVPMTGLLPATARWLDEAFRCEPTEVVFGESSWLVPAKFALRGYRHAGWQIEPRGPMITYARDVHQRLDVLGRGNVIGSRVLVNLAANRHLLRRFFEPYMPVAS